MNNYNLENKIFGKGYLRRITRDIKLLQDEFPSLEYYPDTVKKIYIVKFIMDRLPIKIIIPEMYPFKSPTVYIKDKPYKNILGFKGHKLQNIMRKNKIGCLCCKSMLCTANWTPSCLLVKLVEEIRDFRDIHLVVIYTNLVRQICVSLGITCQEIPDLIMTQMFPKIKIKIPYDYFTNN
jgi:hypothetical protein